MKTYGGRRSCVNKWVGQPKAAFSSLGGAWRYIRAREASGYVAVDRLTPYPCREHGFHVGGAARHRRGTRVPGA
jgi:hypothetical protein